MVWLCQGEISLLFLAYTMTNESRFHIAPNNRFYFQAWLIRLVLRFELNFNAQSKWKEFDINWPMLSINWSNVVEFNPFTRELRLISDRFDVMNARDIIEVWKIGLAQRCFFFFFFLNSNRKNAFAIVFRSHCRLLMRLLLTSR